MNEQETKKRGAWPLLPGLRFLRMSPSPAAVDTKPTPEHVAWVRQGKGKRKHSLSDATGVFRSR